MAQVDELAVTGRDELLWRLETFVRQNLLGDDDDTELTPSSPLLEWGVLNSMNTARLLSFVRDDMGVVVPPTHITGRHFRDLNSIADLLYSLRTTADG